MVRDTDHVHAGSKRLVLASASPRRAELLRAAGYRFDVVRPALDEPPLGGHAHPACLAESIAHYKARCVADTLDEGIVLGGDTVVAVGDQLFGKPAHREDAGRILRALAGTAHQVITGVALIDAGGGCRSIAHAVTTVHMRSLSEAEVEEYLRSGEWAGKAGAYGIQDYGDRFVSRIEGSFSNVVGLPMELVADLLREFGIVPTVRPYPDG